MRKASTACVCGKCRRCINRRATIKYRKRNREKVLRYSREYTRRYRKLHPEQTKEGYRSWARNNIPRVKWNSIKRHARLGDYAALSGTYENFEKWYVTRLRMCRGRCEWCRTKFVIREPHVDHCHRTGHARALVCKLCNRIEGWARSPKHLEQIAKAMRKMR